MNRLNCQILWFARVSMTFAVLQILSPTSFIIRITLNSHIFIKISVKKKKSDNSDRKLMVYGVFKPDIYSKVRKNYQVLQKIH